ncbi:MAG: hypothetical protein CMP22_02545 [Rickettsiales bacterium]|nr:hypothetical protein [Rickettsiales bacterium]|tara:strand:- start:1988 stop:2584 length:597 start_codon:yes stop_codon:yes gene_type:complete
MKRKILSILFIFLITACSSDLNNFGYTRGEYGMTLVTYNATDDLMTQVGQKGVVNDRTPILVSNFANINNVEKSSELGKVVAEQFLTRMVQLGYNVSEVKLRDYMNLNQDGEFSLTRDPEQTSRSHQAAGLVTGTYVLSGDSVMFSARFISLKDARIIAAQDFILEKDQQVKALIKQDQNIKSGKTGAGWYNNDGFDF